MHRRIAQFQNIRPALLQPVKNGSDGPLGAHQESRLHREQAERTAAPDSHRVARTDLGILCRHGSEEHTDELQQLMRTSYAVFCWKKKKNTQPKTDDPSAI